MVVVETPCVVVVAIPGIQHRSSLAPIGRGSQVRDQADRGWHGMAYL